MATKYAEKCLKKAAFFFVYFDGKESFSVVLRTDGKGFFSMVVDPISTLGASINNGKEFSMGHP